MVNFLFCFEGDLAICLVKNLAHIHPANNFVSVKFLGNNKHINSARCNYQMRHLTQLLLYSDWYASVPTTSAFRAIWTFISKPKRQIDS